MAINRTNASYAAVVGSRRFAVDVLSHEKAEVAASFAGMLGLQGDARFEAGGSKWDVLETGAPILGGAAASFDCELVQEVELSPHVLMVGLGRAVRVTPTTPLLFMDGTWASLVRADTAALDGYEAIVESVEASMLQAQRITDDPGRQFTLFIKAFPEIYAIEIPVLRQFFAQHAIAPTPGWTRLRNESGVLRRLCSNCCAGAATKGNSICQTRPSPLRRSSGCSAPSIAGPLWEPESVAGTLQSLAVALAGASVPDRRV